MVRRPWTRPAIDAGVSGAMISSEARESQRLPGSVFIDASACRSFLSNGQCSHPVGRSVGPVGHLSISSPAPVSSVVMQFYFGPNGGWMGPTVPQKGRPHRVLEPKARLRQ